MLYLSIIIVYYVKLIILILKFLNGFNLHNYIIKFLKLNLIFLMTLAIVLEITKVIKKISYMDNTQPNLHQDQVKNMFTTQTFRRKSMQYGITAPNLNGLLD